MTLALTRRSLILGTAAALTASALPALAQDTREVKEMTLGSPDAPVTLIEYASLTCPHCADFHTQVLPQIKTDYVETGKVRLIFREVYFDRPGLWGSMIARCAGEDRYFGVLELLFKEQNNWSRATDASAVVESLYAIGRQAGMTDEAMNACLQDADFAQALVNEYQANATADGIDATPTFILNGEKVSNMPWPDFKARIDTALAG